MKNDFLEYYGKYNVSPVTQDISDIDIHYMRRQKLYRQCGIPLIAFRNADILEVGPGGGYNTLAFFYWGVKHVDLVEANPQGIDDMQKLFEKYKVPKGKHTIFKGKIEDFVSEKKYDFVIAEGFLPNIYNQKDVIDKLQDLVAINGIIVITCSDHVCMFIESIKRLIGILLSKDLEAYEDKVEYLADIFEPQLNKLRGVSRNAKEWVQDQILNPAGINGKELSLMQAVKYLGDDFDILGSSPQMFTDYSWYKDIWYDYKRDYEEQFGKKRLSLLQANTSEIILPMEQADKLVVHFENIKNLAAKCENTLQMNYIGKILEEMKSMSKIASQYLSEDFMKVFYEIEDVLSIVQKDEKVVMEKYTHFFQAFGRTQQYIAFAKKGNRN